MTRFMLVLMCAAALGWPRGAHSEPITIEVGTTSLPPRLLSYFEREITAFEKAHPDIRVQSFDIASPVRPFDASIDKVSRLAANVVGIQGAFDGEMQRMVSQGLLTPIESFLPDEAFSFDDYYENMWTSIAYEDRHWGVPFCMDTMFLFLDWPLFEAAGITEPPKTWDQFVDYAHRLTKDENGDGTPEQYGLFIPPSKGMRNFLWLTLDRQLGVHYLNEGRADFRSGDSIANLKFVHDLANSGDVYHDTITAFGFGEDDGVRAAMILINNHVQMTTVFMESMRKCFLQKNYRVAPIPTKGKEAFNSSYKVYLAVRRSTPEKERASWEFIKWMTRKDISLPEFWYGNPCRIDFLEREDVKRWSAPFCQDWQEAFKAMAWSDPGDLQFSATAMFRSTQIIESYFDNKVELEAALDRFEHVTDNETIFPESRPKVDALFK